MSSDKKLKSGADTNKHRLKNADAILFAGGYKMAEYKLEREADTPADWKTDTVLERDASGIIHEVEVPDDPDAEEVDDDADDD